MISHLIIVIGAIIAIGLFVGGVFTLWANHRWPKDGHTVKAGPYRLHVREAGEGPPVLLIHGAAAHGLDLMESMGDRLKDHTRVLAVDRPGFGHSSVRGLSRRERLASHADALARLVVADCREPPLVVAHSYGAAVALRLALDHPHLVHALVLLAPASHGYVGPVAWYNHVATIPVVGWLMRWLATPVLGPQFAKAGVAEACSPGEMVDDFAAKTGQPLLFRPRSFLANARDLVRANAELAVQELRYGAIQHPVAIIAGPDDKVVYTHRHAERLAASIKDARLCLTPLTGHLPHHQQPDLVIEHVDALLNERGKHRSQAAE